MQDSIGDVTEVQSGHPIMRYNEKIARLVLAQIALRWSRFGPCERKHVVLAMKQQPIAEVWPE